MKAPTPAPAAALRNGWRSGLEGEVAKQLDKAGVEWTYEDTKVRYTRPESHHTYTPDFIIKTRGTGKTLIVETKGIFDADDRKKHLLVRSNNPELDIRFVFSNPNARLRKGSPTTYAIWCKKEGFLFAKAFIPEEWLNE
jgi:hypothetical protein